MSGTAEAGTLPRLSWPLIAGLIGLVVPLSLRPWATIIDPDTYLHIAAGQWMLDHRALPFHDPFSHSMPGATWVPHEWLAEIVLAAVYNAGGWSALILLAAACFGLSLALLAWRLMPHLEPLSLLLAIVLAGDETQPHMLARPHVLAFPILVAWSGALIAARDAGRPPSLWLLPLMLLWANLHGGFMFGLALALWFAGEAVICAGPGRSRRSALSRWGGFVVPACLAGLATPNGLNGVLQPIRMMHMPVLQSSFSEWQPPNLREDLVLIAWVFGLIALGLGLGVTLPPLRLVLLLGLLYEAFQSNRHADLLGWVGPLVIAASLGPQLAMRLRGDEPSVLARWLARPMRPANRLGGLVAGGLLLASAAATLAWPRPDVLRLQPVAAVAAARAMGLTDRPVFNQEGFGGYLIFSGIAPVIDGRIEMYGDDFLHHHIRAELGDRAALTGQLDRYGIGWTLLSPKLEAVQLLDGLPGWRRVYSDGVAVIHARTGS